MIWRLISFVRNNAALNMGIDEAVSEAVALGTSPPTIRFYGWEPSAVSIGCFQRLRDEVDLGECARRGIDVVRRRTGGGCVYHDREGEITYSVIAPEEAMGRDIHATYREVCGWVINALAALGISAQYSPLNDVTVGGKKVSGCAQTRREGVVLQHGTVLFSLDLDSMYSVLRVNKKKSEDKGIDDPRERVTSIAMNSSASFDELLACLQRSFCGDKEWVPGHLGPGERSRASILSISRYEDEAWTLLR